MQQFLDANIDIAMEEDPPGFARPVPTHAHAQHVLEAKPSTAALVLAVPAVPAVPATPMATSPENDAAAQETNSPGQKSEGKPIWQYHAERSREKAAYVRKVVEEKRMEALMEGMGGMKVDVQESNEGDENGPPASPNTLARRRRAQAEREERYWALCARQSYNQAYPVQITEEGRQARKRRNREYKKKKRAEQRRNAMLPPLPPLPTYSGVTKKVQKKEPKKEPKKEQKKEKKWVQRTIEEMFPKAKSEQKTIRKRKKKGKRQEAAAARLVESLNNMSEFASASTSVPATTDTPRLVRQSAFHEAEPEMVEGSLSTHMDVYVSATFASSEFELQAPRPSPEPCAQTISVSEWRARGVLQEMGDVEKRFGGLSIGGGSDVPQIKPEDMDEEL